MEEERSGEWDKEPELRTAVEALGLAMVEEEVMGLTRVPCNRVMVTFFHQEGGVVAVVMAVEVQVGDAVEDEFFLKLTNHFTLMELFRWMDSLDR